MKLRHKILILGLVLLAVSLIATLEKVYAIKTYHVSGSFTYLGDSNYVAHLGTWHYVTHAVYDITYETYPPSTGVCLYVWDMTDSETVRTRYCAYEYGRIYASHTPAFYACTELAALFSDAPGWHDSWITIETPYDC